MARPKKEKELKHHHQIMLRLTDIEYELISTNAQNAQLPLAVYARKQLMNKKVIVKYEIVADLPEIKKLIAEFGKIGRIHSQEMRKEINQCIADIYEMKYKVLKMTGDFTAFSSPAQNHSKENSHGNTKTHSK